MCLENALSFVQSDSWNCKAEYRLKGTVQFARHRPNPLRTSSSSLEALADIELCAAVVLARRIWRSLSVSCQAQSLARRCLNLGAYSACFRSTQPKSGFKVPFRSGQESHLLCCLSHTPQSHGLHCAARHTVAGAEKAQHT